MTRVKRVFHREIEVFSILKSAETILKKYFRSIKKYLRNIFDISLVLCCEILPDYLHSLELASTERETISFAFLPFINGIIKYGW